MNKKSLLIVGGCLLTLGGLYYGYQTYVHSKQTVATMPAQAVSVFVAQKQAVYPEYTFVAKIESQDKVGLRARVSGFLQERLFKEGDIVQQGQTLFVIEQVNFEARVREAKANLARAEAQSVNAKSQYERTKILFKTKDVSEAKLDESLAAYDTAQATVSQMKANLDLANKDLEYTEIKAPMSGKIGEVAFSVGELIGPESGVLATIVKTDPIDAVFSVSENQMLNLNRQSGSSRDDMTVQFYTADGKVYEHQGTLSFVDNVLDEQMNTLKLKASFPNPQGNLISGQYGRIVLTAPKTVDDIVVPMRAVQRDMLSAFVYVVDDNNVIQKRDVKTGMELPNFEVVILDGLSVGERVVIEGFQKVRPGMTVNPENVSLSSETGAKK